MLLLLNFILMVGLRCKRSVFCVNYCHFLLVPLLFYTIIVLGLVNGRGGYPLLAKSNVCFLKPFTSSYKDFKGSFFKILIEPVGREYFFNGDSPKFPLYWTKDLVKFNSISFHSMLWPIVMLLKFLVVSRTKFPLAPCYSCILHHILEKILLVRGCSAFSCFLG